ncbi:hypothetical protein IAI58_19310 (plasmid) [Roseomonas marmotae]|uniref:head-tail joining protein n=1 Tax=Roseomonas marmotae TaxID=2768161 RepID=UPI001AD7127F|nr:hypothetical protein [Roseomonas marmotae]QTI81492.1 hypothetical protein IAI58_19310 [Roseomonas marmotae]
MPTYAWENLDEFLSAGPGEFAVPVTVRLQGGGVRTFLGIFDEPYLNAETGEYELDTERPRVTCKEADVLGVLRGDKVDIGGRTYDVLTSAQPDGTGLAILELSRQ